MMDYPYDFAYMLRHQKTIQQELSESDRTFIEKRIAILGGSTTAVIRDMLELFLLDAGIRPRFYESEYNKYYEDAVYGTEALDTFHPDIVLVLTSVVNIVHRPVLGDTAEDVKGKLTQELANYTAIWDALRTRHHATVIQTNFDVPADAPLGNLEAVLPCSMERYIAVLNERFAVAAAERSNFYICDLHGLSERIGGEHWHDRAQFAAYKFAMAYDVMPRVALQLAHMIKALLGKRRKCLVLDLDNTLWGGVIGDDGLEGIAIGHETPVAESFTTFQRYVKQLHDRGILLAVCSKNDEEVAKRGFNHPDSVLSVDDFVSFRANWLPKNENIRAIAEEINIGTDSLVFIDDNPSERAIVRETMPEVAVPEVAGGDVFSYIRAVEEAGYFESIAISEDDRKRNAAYQENKKRRAFQQSLPNYEDFLASLEMKAEIAPFHSLYYDRIAQLTNKTNQFNLTTRRFTRAEIEQMGTASEYLTLYGRLSDRFGDNGLVSVIIGKKDGTQLRILLWLMSCRVLKRGMEFAMLDVLAGTARAKGCSQLMGEYLPTKKNRMVEDWYQEAGFSLVNKEDDGSSLWQLDLANYQKKSKYIQIQKAVMKGDAVL